jgi:hypothetical protein
MGWYRAEKEKSRVINITRYRSKNKFKKKGNFWSKEDTSVTKIDKVRLEKQFINSHILQNQPIFAIDGDTLKIKKVISYHGIIVPQNFFIDATPEKLIKIIGAAKHCRSVIKGVHQTGEPQSITLPITLPVNPPTTITKCIYLKKIRFATLYLHMEYIIRNSY